MATLRKRAATSLFLTLALWIFLPSALVALIFVGVGLAYPDLVGGTNIGAGAILFLAYVGMAIGVGFFIAAMVEKRQQKRSKNG